MGQDVKADDQQSEQTTVLKSRHMTDEDAYYYERLYKEPVESLARIEETAKFLIGATTTASGLLAAAFTLVAGDSTVPALAVAPTFLCWAASILFCLFVLLPQEYAAGRDEPGSIRRVFVEARDRKFRRLFWGTILFALGLLYCIIPFLV